MPGVISSFDEQYYLQSNPDVADAVKKGQFSTGRQHFDLHGNREQRNPNAMVDMAFYLSHNADVAEAVRSGKIASGWDHWLTYGLAEGRAASATLARFDAAAYLRSNNDVAAAVKEGAFRSALQHFVLYGAAEDRAAPGIARTNLNLTWPEPQNSIGSELIPLAGVSASKIDISAGGVDKLILSGFTDRPVAVSGFEQHSHYPGGPVADTNSDYIYLAVTSTGPTKGSIFGASQIQLAHSGSARLGEEDYNEATGGRLDMKANAVNVITEAGYAGVAGALTHNGGNAGEAGLLVFFNTSTSQTELYYVADADTDTAVAGSQPAAYLLLSFSSISLTGIADFSREDFALLII